MQRGFHHGLLGAALVLALVRDANNMGAYAAGFFPPNFSEWRGYLKEMVITLQIALWGTALAVVCAVPCGLLCSSKIGRAHV